MPGTQAGVYAGAQTAGTEVSSTFEGRHLTVREDELIHPYHSDGFVQKGDPVCLCDAGVQTTFGNAVGVAFKTGTSTSDWIAIDTEGIFNMTVYAQDDDGGSDIEIGDPLFIRAGALPGAADADGTGDGEISKMMQLPWQVPFGYALGSLGSGGTGVIAVKVHWQNHYQNDGQVRKTIISANPGTYASAFKTVVTHNIAQTDTRICAWSMNLEPAALAMEEVLGGEFCTYIGAGAIAHDVTGLFVEVQGGSTSIGGSFHGLKVYAAPGSNPTGNSHVVRLESNPSTVTWLDSFINFVGNPNFTFYHSGQGTAGASTGSHTTGQAGFMLVNMGGATRYIALYTS